MDRAGMLTLANEVGVLSEGYGGVDLRDPEEVLELGIEEMLACLYE